MQGELASSCIGIYDARELGIHGCELHSLRELARFSFDLLELV